MFNVVPSRESNNTAGTSSAAAADAFASGAASGAADADTGENAVDTGDAANLDLGAAANLDPDNATGAVAGAMLHPFIEHDWSPSENASCVHFFEEADKDRSNVMKILTNRFRDPHLSTDSAEEDKQARIDFIDYTKDFESKPCGGRMFVPGLKPMPLFVKTSTLTFEEHSVILRILSKRDPLVLDAKLLGKPTKQDHTRYMAIKAKYLKEQQEYKDWAQEVWTKDHCMRIWYPHAVAEALYERSLRMKAYLLRGYPYQYELAMRDMTLECHQNCVIELKEVLTTVKLSQMPFLKYPESLTIPFTIIRPYPAPGLCPHHTYLELKMQNQIIRARYSEIFEIHSLLASYAKHHNCQFIASEKALQTLVQYNKYWVLPVYITETINQDGDAESIIVIDSEFTTKKESAPIRTYKAFRHLLENALIPPSELDPVPDIGKSSVQQGSSNSNMQETVAKVTEKLSKINIQKGGGTESGPTMCHIGDNVCCGGVVYKKAAPRSFKKWQFSNPTTHKTYDMIIHCPHKARDQVGEVILEPIPEYQLDLGASELPTDTVRSLALSLLIREKASILLARVDGQTGEVVRFQKLFPDRFHRTFPQITQHVIHAIVAMMSQIRGFPPGTYLLQHEPKQGSSVNLFVHHMQNTRVQLDLSFDRSQLLEPVNLKTPPTISTDLLPYHKLRNVAPCAFYPVPMKGKKKKKMSSKKRRRILARAASSSDQAGV